jgi:4-aminobutyrate aminotransferase-like enzyme
MMTPQQVLRSGSLRHEELRRGDLLPHMVEPPPGPRARSLSERLRRSEAPGINTLYRGRDNLLYREALGANVLDVDGNRYIDLTAGFGVAAVGHRHPAVVKALVDQGSTLIHALGDAIGHPGRVELAERLVEWVPVEDAQVYFAISGADAVEIALKTAHLATGHSRFLTFEPAYHGVTLGALAATSRDLFRKPFADPLESQIHRLPFGCPVEKIEKLLERTKDLAAALVEPVVGREGVLFPPPGWLHSLQELCRRHGLLFIADEIFTGFGRTGHAFAVDAEEVRPDLLCCGKALGGGLPIGAVVGHRELMAAWQTPGEARHTATFVAHPLACATALATLEVIEGEGLVERSARLGDFLEEQFSPWPERFSTLSTVRGRGLLWALELDNAHLAGSLVESTRARGILLLAGGPEGRVVQIVPPLTIHRRQLEACLDILRQGLEDLEETP